jgi:carbonic anhydrase/acetyltransferase-like protein (isoleucine patch superfamily)
MPVYALGNHVPAISTSGRVWIAPDANVIGRVTLGEDVSVWFHAVARGDCELIQIGARTNIQEHAMLHTDSGYPLGIGEDCTIGHGAILHGCTIGSQSLIGMGAVLLNGCKIGSCSMVGAHALVTEGKAFPDRSLIVGSPARAIRALTEEEVARLKHSADHYVANGRRFAQELREVGHRQ